MKIVPAPTSFPNARPSGSAEKSREAELARLRALSVEQRILEALALGRKFADFQPTPKR